MTTEGLREVARPFILGFRFLDQIRTLASIAANVIQNARPIQVESSEKTMNLVGDTLV